MLPLLCHAWLRPSLSVRNEKGTRFTLEDCTDAFLQSDLLEEIYVEPPAEAQEPADVVWRLHKALPGLKGGPVAWGTRIDGILGSPPLNFRRSRVDPCLWTNSTTGVRIGRHMDDFIKTGPPMAVQAVTEYLERVAQLKVTGVLDKFGEPATLQTVETAWRDSVETARTPP